MQHVKVLFPRQHCLVFTESLESGPSLKALASQSRTDKPGGRV
jgi:hypothetical protein